MAILALNRGVRTQQREAVLVVLDLLRGDGPALHGVTLLAIRAHLSAVYIALFVAIRAIFADILEHWLNVTGHALHFFVHAAEGIVGLVVIEFRHSTNGAPTRRRVTVLTGYGQWAVRITSGLVLLRWRRYRGIGRDRSSYRSGRTREEHKRPESELEEDSRSVLRSAAGVAALKIENLKRSKTCTGLIHEHYLDSNSPIQLYQRTVLGQLAKR